MIVSGSGNDTIILRAGDGGASLSDADIIQDNPYGGHNLSTGFTDGLDVFGLDDGLAYSDLTIAQGTGDYSNDTIISITATSEYLAIVKGFDANLITEADIVVL